MSLKRKRKDGWEDFGENEQSGFNDSRNGTLSNGEPAPQTPQKRRRGRPPGSTNKIKSISGNSRQQKTPQSRLSGRILFETPSKANADGLGTIDTPAAHNVDRSARRRSVRTLIERGIAAGDDGTDIAEDEDLLATHIWGAEETEENDLHGSNDEESITDPAVPATPSKRGPKGPRRKRTPTPPSELPPHEQYFFQNWA
ncbi:MAG: hypothetical protein Q9198_008078, partial [Flavoplaca austrocitrina]